MTDKPEIPETHEPLCEFNKTQEPLRCNCGLWLRQREAKAALYDILKADQEPFVTTDDKPNLPRYDWKLDEDGDEVECRSISGRYMHASEVLPEIARLTAEVAASEIRSSIYESAAEAQKQRAETAEAAIEEADEWLPEASGPYQTLGERTKLLKDQLDYATAKGRARRHDGGGGMNEQDEKLVTELMNAWCVRDGAAEDALREAITRTKESTRRETLLEAADSAARLRHRWSADELRKMADEPRKDGK